MSGRLDPLRVRLLGGFAIDSLSEAAIGSRKARLLTKVLALARGAPVHAAELTDILWPGTLPSRPADQLGVLASRLRRVLGAERLTRSDAGYALHVDWLDVDELRALTVDAVAALDQGRLAVARTAAGAALALVRGPLLPEDDGDWLTADRAATEAFVVQARSVAATAALRAGDAAAAELAANVVLAHDPYDEVALRVVMQAQVALGRPASALASYARARERLAEDLGVSPSQETEALHTLVLSGGAGHPTPTATRPAIIGRDRELAELHAQLAAATARPRVVLVVGHAGIGKSTLVRHFADHTSAGGARVLLARADELGRNLPLQPLLDAVASDPDPPEPARGGATATSLPDIDADRFRWFDRIARSVVAGGQPAVLIVEDVHWADRATVDWLAWVRHRPVSLLVVATGRPGTRVPGAIEMTLGPLRPEEIGRLIGADASRAAEVHDLSDGNPLFALALASAGASERPASIDDVVSSSLDHLDADLVEFARAIAVLDAAHDLDLMAGIVRRPPTELLALLERLVDADLLIERGSGFAFRHPLVRDVLSRTTGTARSALLHREAAHWLVNRPDSDPLAIALHARLGGANDLAADALVRAATISLERADLAAAEQQLRASVEARPSAEARAALARVLMVAQRLDEAAAEAEMAIALGGGPSAFEVAGWIEYYRRRYDRAERLADEASARAERTSPVRASALALAGRIRHGHGHLADAEERLAIAIGGPPEIKALAEVWLGQVRIHQGRPEDALEVVEHALLDPEHIAHPYAALHGRFCRVVAFGQLGEAAAALRACDELRAAIEHAGSRGVRFRAIELNVRSWVLRGIGRPDEAETLSLEAIDLNGAADGSGPHSQGFAEAYWVGFLDLADGYLAAGRVDDAARVERLLAALDHWDGTMAWHQRHRLGLIRARIARASGDTDRAAELAATVMTDSAGRGCDRYAALAHVQLALAGGDGDRERIDRSVDVLRRCAGFELPGLLDQLADTCRVDAWAAEATHRRVALTARL